MEIAHVSYWTLKDILQEPQEFVDQYLQLLSPVNDKVEIGCGTKSNVAIN